MIMNPFMATIFIDSCTFNPDAEPDNGCSEEIFGYYKKDKMNVIICHSVMKEAEYPNTPSSIKDEAKLHSIATSLTTKEEEEKNAIWSMVTGDDDPEKIKQDSDNVFEAHKCGGYYVTNDQRIIKKRRELESICNAVIVSPCELVGIINRVKNI